ncbi:hypothetical protein SPRG_19255 [Saprolegnia parasitica CBS 223.65]|uniref:Transglutaminase-like domain-containing protein n=1 Tax=Saprolegnia parasitica (strain CBS 223.65) TaxID=695850 RepID=A0A067CSF4_SAPPC|nr:hypothetical protein SPRG_19255 [Saprolegnia parasitica CBS 223.65]KDO33634.1 hypothetical protein SPRG_19255 [Saprolegnia parasitica CBS 223.65]|eukprot:XP_012195674.1 hypothetical protein SPRG_19255 [Saprolegnia parasitica CBS 223.65]
MVQDVRIIVLFEGREYSLEVDPAESAETLAFQLYSLCDIADDDQVLLTYDGQLVSPEDGVAKIIQSMPLLFLFRRSAASGSFDPTRDTDWRETCSRVVAATTPLVQLAYTRQDGTVLCSACATTCSPPDHLVTPILNDVATRNVVRGSFVTELAVVIGAIDVLPPTGFTKLPMDLHHGMPGPFAFLCVRKGGKQAPIAHIQVVPGRTLPPGYTSLYVTATTSICYRRAPPSLFRSLAGFGVRDVAIGTDHASSMVPCRTALTSSGDWTLAYDLAPFAGTICGSHGECLFQERIVTGPAVSFTTLSGAQVEACAALEATLRTQWAAAQATSFTASEASLRSTLEHQSQRVHVYERKDKQARALAVVPVATLQARARANTNSVHKRFEDEVLHQLIHWFKHEFFSWMNQPPCQVCGEAPTQLVRTDGPTTPEEIAGEASRVEVYQCASCRNLTRFPRYNDPVKLLETRTGRCGEWANCFTLCCRAMGYEARYVLDFTDHVWTEVYSSEYGRWLHCDPCEDQLDCPLTYEVGWGKELHYIFAFSVDEVVDVIRRYTATYEGGVLDRRTRAREDWLAAAIAAINQRVQAALPSARRETLRLRAVHEEAELGAAKHAKASETEGRVSGSKEWKDSRQESGGKTDDAASTTTTSMTELTPNDVPPSLWQSLLVQLVQGCVKACCTNPFCLHTAKKTPGFDLSSHVASSLQRIPSLQATVTSRRAFDQLVCPSTDANIRSQLWAASPIGYWPLQDDDTHVAVDVSGHDAHLTHTCRAVSKPMATKVDKTTTGYQLLPHDMLRLTADVSAQPWSVVFLVQWHAYANTPTEFVHLPELELRLGLTGDHRLALTTGSQTTSSALPLSMDTTYHVALVHDSARVIRVFLNATEIVSQAATPSPRSISLLFGTQALALVPILSHLALLSTALDPSTLEGLARLSLPGAKLTVAGVKGDTTDIQHHVCTLDAAQMDSDFALSSLHLWSGTFFDGLQCAYTSTSETVDGPQHVVAAVKDKTPSHSLALLPGEVIVHVSGRRGAWTDALSVTTNFGRSLTGGGSGGNPFEMDIAPGHAVRAFCFHLDDHVYGPVVFTAPAPRGPAFQALAAIRATVKAGTLLTVIAAVRLYLGNLVATPNEPKVRKIKSSNAYFAKNVALLDDATVHTIFTGASFEAVTEGGDVFWVFQGNLHAAHAALYDLTTFAALVTDD